MLKVRDVTLKLTITVDVEMDELIDAMLLEAFPDWLVTATVENLSPERNATVLECRSMCADEDQNEEET